MKLLRTYAAYEVHDLEQEVIEITSDDCTHGDSFRIFCFVGHRKNGCTFEQEIMPGNVWEMAKELAKTEEEAAAFIAQTEKAASCQRWAGDMTCWAVVDANGIRRIFKADGRHAFGGPYIIVNYREVKP